MIKAMETPGYFTIPGQHSFTREDEVMLCAPTEMAAARVRDARQGASPDEAVIILDYPNLEFGKVFPIGTLVVATEEIALESSGEKSDAGGALLLHPKNKGRKPLARQYRRFLFTVQNEPERLQVNVDFARDECAWEHSFALDKAEGVGALGRWLIDGNALRFSAWAGAGGGGSTRGDDS
jgi:hypothetical protein